MTPRTDKILQFVKGLLFKFSKTLLISALQLYAWRRSLATTRSFFSTDDRITLIGAISLLVFHAVNTFEKCCWVL